MKLNTSRIAVEEAPLHNGEGEPSGPAGASSLEALLDDSRDHLQLQMLLIEVASCNESADFDLVARAYHFALGAHAGQIRRSGEPFLQHSVEVARILAQLRLDSTTVAAGLLHDVIEDTSVTQDRIESEFGDKIAALIDGVTKIERFHLESREARQAETFRKMLLSMVEDIRVILVKFADRLHNMRTLDALDAGQRQRISHETLEVYAPLAHRLGLARMRWELEDRSLKHLEPGFYREIRDKVAMRREERERLIDSFRTPLEEELRQSGIESEITGRPKNFYSIYNKMRSRVKPFEEIYDLTAVRIIVGTVRECYHTLGLVHTLYRPIPDRFKDYIATPKTNMYQSLHTTVIGPQGMSVEVQIRTWEMHHTAEIGIAAHWRYKAGAAGESSDLDQQMNWLRQVLDWQRDATDPVEFMENLKIELFQDEIFVFTPKGDLHQLPKEATPIDFAFAIHTDIGLHCLTAKVDGQIVPLSAPLSSGAAVQIITSPHQKPSPSWLEMVKTAKARQSIRRWLKEEQFSQSVRLGQEILEHELKRYRHRAGSEALEELATELKLADTEHLYARIGSGDLSVSRVVNRLVPNPPKRRVRPLIRDRRGIRIQGMHDMVIHFGKCCTPIPGDPIIGLITRGRGLSVHRTDCPNFADLAEDPERLTPVAWDLEEEQAFTVQLLVRGHDRKYFLSDVTRVISDTGANIVSCATRTLAHVVEETFWIDVHDSRQLQKMVKKLRGLEGVTEVQRVDEAAVEPPGLQAARDSAEAR